jgi:hypothetical protein
VDLEGKAYRCRFCESALALAGNIISRVRSSSLFIHIMILVISHTPKVFFSFDLCEYVATDQNLKRVYRALLDGNWVFNILWESVPLLLLSWD